jgi:hypothetical protein
VNQTRFSPEPDELLWLRGGIAASVAELAFSGRIG